MNEVYLIGNVGKDPETRYTAQGVAVMNFTLATSERRKDNTVDTTWHNVRIFGKFAEHMRGRVLKGDETFVRGKIVARDYTSKTGEKRRSYEINAFTVRVCARKERGGEMSAGTPDFHADQQPVYDESNIPF
jgi:single-strand DNA-binding protein